MPSTAQVRPPAPEPAADANQASTAAGDIIVTATKRADSVQHVPISVEVATQAALQTQNLTDTTDLKRLVPGLQFITASTVGNAVFVIRGVGTNASGFGLEQSVGVSFDGVPLARNAGSVADLVDIQRVEVLKGPQGMLFGKNASAGLINIVSQVPKLRTTEFIGRLSYGTLNYQQYSGTVNVPLSDTIAARITAWKFKRDGFVHEANTGQDLSDKNTEGLRVKLRWQPSDALDVNLTAEVNGHNQNGGGFTIRQFEPANFTAANSGALIQTWELAHGTQPSQSNYTARGVVSPYGYYDRGSTKAATGQLDYAVGGGTLTAIVSYRRVHNDNPFDPFASDNPYNQQLFNRDEVRYNQLTGELRYASPATDRLRYVAGVFAFRLNLNDQFRTSIAGSVPTPVNDLISEDVRNTTVAAFGEATFDLTPKLHLIAGLRASSDHLDAAMDRTFLAPTVIITGFTSPGASFGLYQTSAQTTYHDLSWRTGLQYQVERDVMLYATASRGYKGPGIAYSVSSSAVGLAQANNGIVNPEVVHAFEVGLKSQFLDRHLTFNISLYSETFDNFQTSVRVPGPALVYVIQNAKQLRSEGVDVDASWRVTSNFTLSASVNYDHARYTDFANASCYPGQTAALGCVAGQQDLKGWPLANAPEWTTNVTARYETGLGRGWNGYVQANYEHRGDVVFNTTADPHERQNGYGLVNASIGLRSPGGRWGVSVFGNNLGDVRYVDRVNPQASGAFYVQSLSYGSLRTFGVALDTRF
jgi:iron complex outermembrane receptor protein